MTIEMASMTKEQDSSLAFLIDADNLSASALEQAFEHLERLGARVSVRRAYGGHEKLIGMKDVLKRYSVRSFVNHGKGTTDVLLVIDAMDLLHKAEMPLTVAIGSSDGDFAPLAVRLREAGRRVICFCQRDKAATDDLRLAYDELVCFDLNPQADAPAPAAARAARPARQALPASQRTTAKAAKTATPALEDPAAARRILDALPEWIPDTVKQLNQIGTALRESKIPRGSRPLHDLLRRFPSYFEVLPSTGPAKQVRLLKRP